MGRDRWGVRIGEEDKRVESGGP
ncbi:uncharacterized protein G2W53_034806 [Senna tora]|uniref:Uncharacterized protein n=1 Tax=Senna tora TaxID=362788 RepID=A0A834W845_9FABA|nr:uncharacterized protein G2W53_034806 [Senna tora]